MRYFRLTVEYPPSARHPMHELIDERSDVRYSEMIHWNVGEESEFTALFRVTGDPDPYVEALDDVESLIEYEIVPADEQLFYVYAREPPSAFDRKFYAAFAATSLVVVPPIRFGPRGRVSFGMIGEAADVDAAVAALPDDLSIELDAATEYRPGVGGIGMTARQRDALQAAFEVGYYDVPRSGTVDDVADRLDVSTSTAGSHLRKAESALVEAFLTRGGVEMPID